MSQIIQKNLIVKDNIPDELYDKDLSPIKPSDMLVYYIRNGKEYTSYRGMRQGELAETLTIEYGETGKRFKEYLTVQEIKVILDQQLSQSQEA